MIGRIRSVAASRHAAIVLSSMLLLTVGALVASTPDPESGAAAERAARDVHEPRRRISINDGWRYSDGVIAGAQEPSFDDSRWVQVDLPHTWNVSDAFGKDGKYRRGEGWYRRTLQLDRSQSNRRLFLYFEGANQVAELFVNGRAAGRHVGGYTAFAFDITELVTLEAPNQLAVRVDNSHDPDIPPLNADFTFFGGIYRDTWLISTDPVHIDVLDHASPGVFADTPEVSAERASVRVRGAVVNRSAVRRRLEIRHRLVDPEGAQLLTFSSGVDAGPGERVTFETRSPPVSRPKLWSPSSPSLYRVSTEIRAGRRTLDRVEVPLGFRWFRADAQQGFFLNGERVALHGTNRHQDLAGLGNALPDSAHRRDVQLVKENGFNFLRLAHYPQDPAVLNAADELGLAIWEEIPVVNLVGLSEAFAGNSERMLVEMIRQHYNHPSVLMWGYMNEALLQRPTPKPEGYEQRLVEFARRLEAVARAEDPSRLTVTAISYDEIDDGSGLQDVPQVLGLNLYFGWYYRDLDTLGPYLDDLHARHPQRPLLISEYGADSDERVHTLSPRAFDFSTEHHQRFHESSFAQLRVRPWLLGSAVWNQFDFASAGRQDTKPALNQKGLYYNDRTPKDSAYYYRASLLDEPVLHIAAREWSTRVGSRAGDEKQPIVVYSNLGEVELTVNGRSQGRVAPQNATARWTVELRDGDNLVEARGMRGNQQVRDAHVIRYTDRSSLFGESPSSVREIAVNAGGHYSVIGDAAIADSAARGGELVWEADRSYVAGSWGYTGGREVRSHKSILGTPLDPLLQDARIGATAYRFDVPDGEYDVSVGLAEIEHTAPGARVMDATINGSALFSGLDLVAEHGPYVAVERSARVVASDGNGIIVRLTARKGETLISSLHVQRAAQPVDVMTFNVRYAHGPPNSWEERRPVAKAMLEQYAPHIVGTQEGVHRQVLDLATDLPAYAWIGEGREGGDRGEYMAIFYRRDRFEALEHEHFWLSDTPAVAGSRTWGNRLARMVTWVKLRDQQTHCTFYVVNTHFDHEVQAAREKSANLLLERINSFDRTRPVILLGDFNAAAGANPAYDTLTGKDAFVDAWRELRKPEPSFGTFHEFKGEEAARGAARIDWILTRGALDVRSSEILTFAHGRQYPSDHFPVIARVSLERCGCCRQRTGAITP